MAEFSLDGRMTVNVLVQLSVFTQLQLAKHLQTTKQHLLLFVKVMQKVVH